MFLFLKKSVRIQILRKKNCVYLLKYMNATLLYVHPFHPCLCIQLKAFFINFIFVGARTNISRALILKLLKRNSPLTEVLVIWTYRFDDQLKRFVILI